MTSWCLRIGVALLLLGVPLFAQSPGTRDSGLGIRIPDPESRIPAGKLPDGQPDVQGFWGSVLGGTVSLTHPMTGGQEFQQRIGARVVNNPSRIVDPPDGRVPYQPWAAALQAQQESSWERPTRPEQIDTQSRCLTSNVRLFMLPSTFQIIQAPGSIVFIWDDYHAYRVIPLDGRPHPGAAVKLWMGDGRGHWEGNTLVIDTTNLNGKPRMSVVGDFISEHARLTERLTFLDAGTMTYEVTIDDPTVFTRPWTMRVAEKRRPEDELWEFACHEGEKSSDHMLSADQTGN